MLIERGREGKRGDYRGELGKESFVVCMYNYRLL